jgi:hypothetical protein
MENCLKKMENPQLENLTKKLLIDQGNYFILPLTEINQTNFSRGKKFLSRNTHFTPYYNSGNNTLNLFYHSIQKDQEICVTINNKETYFFEIKKGYWRIILLGNYDRVNHVKIDDGVKIIYKKTFDSNFKEIFKANSFIRYEKNN